MLLHRAHRAAESAALLLAHADINGACSRAYYAMFDAARAALLATGAGQEQIRTHAGLIATFGLRLVKPGRIEPSLGRMLNRAHEIRLMADYTGSLVDAATARQAVHDATAFVEAMHRFVSGLRNA